MPCRSDTSSRALSILYSIQSGSELKEPRLISDSTHPGGFATRLWGSPKLWRNSFIRPLWVKRYWFYRTWRTAHFWAYPLVVTDNIFVHHLHLPKIGDTFLNGVSLSDLIWTYVVTGAYCLVQGRVWRFYQHNKARLDSLSSFLNPRNEVRNHTQMRQIYVYSLRGVMEICRYSKQPKANALIDCIYHHQAPCCALLSPADSRRRASKVAWDLCPDRVQELAGYPLNGRPSAVTMLELL